MSETDHTVAVVTGASAGVGRAVAVAFGRMGWRVGLLARDEVRLPAAQAEVEAAGGQALPIAADVADADAVCTAAARVEAELGELSVWVNCAMATVFAPARAMQPAEYRRVTEVAYLGYVHGTLAALASMRRRNAGTIVQVGSALAYRAIPLQSAYCAAKFAIRGFTDAIRSELIHEGSGIRLTMVQLPAVNTPQFDWARNRLPMRPRPLAPIIQPEAAAKSVRFAAVHAPRELWVGASTVQTILGGMVAPGVLDRLLAARATHGQMSNEPEASGRPDNLFQPVQGAFCAQGRFETAAKRSATAFHPTLVRGALGLGAACVLGGLAYWLARRSGGAIRPAALAAVGR